MSPAIIASRPRAAIRNRRVLIIGLFALCFTSLGCGSSQPTTEVRGVVEVKDTSSEVELIEPLCITNTPTYAHC